jgi:hypothetical protein
LFGLAPNPLSFTGTPATVAGTKKKQDFYLKLCGIPSEDTSSTGLLVVSSTDAVWNTQSRNWCDKIISDCVRGTAMPNPLAGFGIMAPPAILYLRDVVQHNDAVPM